MVEKCGAKEGASKADIEHIITEKTAKTMQGKCTQACLAETAGMVNNNTSQINAKKIESRLVISSILVTQLEGTKLNADKTLTLIGMAFDFDEKIMSATRVVISICKDVTGPDRCTAIANIIDCARKIAKKNNYPEVM